MTTDVPDWYELGERVSDPFNLNQSQGEMREGWGKVVEGSG